MPDVALEEVPELEKLLELAPRILFDVIDQDHRLDEVVEREEIYK